jgi:CAAX protease family protein
MRTKNDTAERQLRQQEFTLPSFRKSAFIECRSLRPCWRRHMPNGRLAMHWDFVLILILLGAAVPWLGRRRIRQLIEASQTTKIDRLTLYASTILFQWIAASVILWRTAARGIRGAQLGLAVPDPALAALVSVVLAALVFASQIFSLRRLTSQASEIEGILPQLALKLFPQDDIERLAFFSLVATVAICEELIYRGFVQRVVESSVGGSAVAGIVGSAVFFSLAHLYQGRKGLASTFVIGVMFSGIRAWTGTLLPPMLAHFVADITVGLLAPGRLRAAISSHEGNQK